MVMLTMEFKRRVNNSGVFVNTKTISSHTSTPEFSVMASSSSTPLLQTTTLYSYCNYMYSYCNYLYYNMKNGDCICFEI